MNLSQNLHILPRCLAASCFLLASSAFCADMVPVVLGGESQTNVLLSLAKDHFNRSDTGWQTPSSSPNAIGDDWEVGAGDWKISSGQVVMAGGVHGLLFQTSTKTANTQGRSFELQAESTLNVGNGFEFAGVVFNVQSASDYYALRYAGDGTLQFLRFSGGSPVVLGSSSFSHGVGSAYRIVVSSSQPQIFDWNIIDVSSGLSMASGSVTDSGSGYSDGFGGAYSSSSQSGFDDFRLQANETLPAIKTIKGIPVLTQDSNIVPMDSFCANTDNRAITQEEVRKAGINGIDLVFARGILTSVTSGGHFVADIPRLDQGIQDILAKNPDAQIILYAGGMHPDWYWHNYYAHETKLKNYSGGLHPMPDPNSPDYQREAASFLRGVVEYVEAQPYAASVVGYQIGIFEGSEFVLPRSYYYYANATKNAFRAWVEDKYVSIGHLQTAWNDGSMGSFAAVTVPTPTDFSTSDWGAFRDPSTRQKVVDFAAFWQESNANLLTSLCHEIKITSTKKPLVGAFYGYTLELGQGVYTGHLALRQVLDSPYVDFVAAPYSYAYRNPNVWLGDPDSDKSAGAYHGPADSVLANGKLFFTEDDSRTYLTTDSDLSHFPDLAGTLANLRRNHLENACHGTGIWRLDLYSSGWYDSDGLMLEMGLQKHINNLLNQDAETDGAYAPEVALIIDEDSSFHVATRDTATDLPKVSVDMFLRDHLHRGGVNYGVYLMSDLIAGRVPDCSAYFFAGCYEVTRTERNWINENLKRDGKALVWFFGSGLYDETGWGLDRMSDLIGLDIAEYTNPVSSGMPPTSALDGLISGYPGWNQTRIAGQPEWYVQNLPPDAIVLGNYSHTDGSQLPGFVVADKGDWTTVYMGSSGLYNQLWMLGLMRAIGVHQYLDSDATVPCYAGRGIIGIWPTEAMSGTVQLKESSDVYDLYSGSLLYQNVSSFPVNLAQWEVAGYKTKPAGENWEGGMFYAWQRSYFAEEEITAGRADAEGDPDGDRFFNYREFYADTNPTNAASLLLAEVSADSSGAKISFETSVDRDYFVSTSTDLESGIWMPLGNAFSGTGGIVDVVDTNNLPQAFYRINALLP